MKLTVLGRYGPFPAAGGACSGYLIETDDVTIVVELGSGVLSRLLEYKPDLSVDCIFLSHLHSDHMSDMLVLRYALQQLSACGRNVPLPLHVVTPMEPELEYRQLAASCVFNIVSAYDGLRVKFGGLTVSLHQVVHPTLTFAMDIECGGKRIFYTGDTGWLDELVTLCAGADVLLADTCFLTPDKTTPASAHLTAREAAELARAGGVQRLICTHIWSGGYTDEMILAEATPVFPNTLVAEERHEYYV